MDSFFKMVDVQTVLFIYMAVGFFCRKKGIFNDAARDKLTDFVVLITLPCMIFESFHMEFSLESLKQGGVAVLIATAMAAAALLLGKVLYNRFPYQEKSILQYGPLVSTSGFAGLPVVSGAYGDEGLFLGSLFIIPTRILMWSAGISLFTKADAKQAVRKVLLNPGIIAVEVGLVWMLFQLPLPHFVDAAVDNLYLPHGHGPGGGHPGRRAPQDRVRPQVLLSGGGAPAPAARRVPRGPAAAGGRSPHRRGKRGAHRHAHRLHHRHPGPEIRGGRPVRLQVCVYLDADQPGHRPHFDPVPLMEKGAIPMQQSYDVVIIGGGVVGSAIARELSRYKLRIAVLEKESDVCTQTSGRNTGMLHAGFLYKTGSLKAICAVEGNQEFEQVARELDVPFKRTGKLIVGFTDEHRQRLEQFMARGEANGVKGLELIDRKRMDELDPSAGGNFAMWCPASGILDPFLYTIALAENAVHNGAEYHLNCAFTGETRQADGTHLLHTTRGDFHTRWVVNSAGLNSAVVSEQLGIPGYVIKPVKGEYFVLDKLAGQFAKIPVYPAPNPDNTFDTHATPTVDGNVLVGPDSQLARDFQDY